PATCRRSPRPSWKATLTGAAVGTTAGSIQTSYSLGSECANCAVFVIDIGHARQRANWFCAYGFRGSFGALTALPLECVQGWRLQERARPSKSVMRFCKDQRSRGRWTLPAPARSGTDARQRFVILTALAGGET